MREMKEAVKYFRKQFKGKSVKGRHVVAITDEDRLKYPILVSHREVVVDNSGGKRRIRIL